MKLLETIEQIAKAHRSIRLDPDSYIEHINAAHRFLFGKKYSKKELSITPAASALIDRLGLTGDDFTFIGNGANGTAYGNHKVVLRLESQTEDFDDKFSIPITAIPDGLSAKIIEDGECNGVKYRLMERLNTKQVSTLQEIIPFLFKARDVGVAYWAVQNNNFGYAQNGDLKVLDHDHFQKLGVPAGNFEKSLEYAVRECCGDEGFPLLTFDDHNTYVIFSPEKASTAEHGQLQKKLLASLSAVGINGDSIEIVNDPPVVRIARTEVTYGTPPQTEELADYIDKNLKAAIRCAPLEGKASDFLSKLSGTLNDSGGKAKELAAGLPTTENLAKMDRKAFLQFYDGFISLLDACSSGNVSKIDAIFDEHFKASYPARGQKTG